MTLAKATAVVTALAGGSLFLWWAFCGPLTATFEDGGGSSYGPTGPLSQIGVAFFMAAVVLVPLAALMGLILAASWAIRQWRR